MKHDFVYVQEKDSKKMQYKQETIEYILSLNYGDTITNEELCAMLHYKIDDEYDYKRFKTMMSNIKKYLLNKGRILKGVPGIGYYILKPKQASQYCFRTYVQSASRLYDKSAYVLDKIDTTEMSDVRLEEIKNMIDLNNELIEKVEGVIDNSAYYSRKDYYDSLKD